MWENCEIKMQVSPVVVVGKFEKRSVFVFGKGDYVVCGSKGVCTVEDVTKLVMPGVDEKREYYVLKPVYNISTTVYIPVDAGKESMRGVLSAAEANSLIRRIDVGTTRTARKKGKAYKTDNSCCK